MCARKARGRRGAKKKQQLTDTEPVLVLIHGEDLGKRYVLDRPLLSIGRADCDINIEHEAVSPMHAEVESADGVTRVMDKDSRFGTMVNDRFVEACALAHGDRLKIGRTIFRFLCDGDLDKSYKEEQNRLMTTDGLTGLGSKRAFRETLEMELRRCIRYGRELSVFIYGVDQTEEMFRLLGDMAGDSLLVQVSQAAQEHLSRDDFHARYRDDTFAVILPEVNQAEALVRAEKLRQGIAEKSFQWKSKKVPLTLSIGVATFEKTMEDAEDFIQEIDRNLFQSTRAGRNRVIGVEGGVTRCG